ncbi:hypothetical protein B0H63DRAFT_528441 [Podospora didyma]|uniref:Uncharacterized protein n=1 Tax=Podospora didyma TaxID=330526 RepID=A0AAE0N3H7_9PEZI|nr:hypothetical protein B0H63DRAFT_528441 [Podospora didyma]
MPALRFPKPQGSQILANWVSNSSPDILQTPDNTQNMQPPNMSDSSSLADSAYEIINSTDSESQDGRMSESTGSLEVSRPEDVHSLDGSEDHSDNHYDTDSTDSDAESDQSSNASSIRYADQSLQNPSTPLPGNSLHYDPSSEVPEGPEKVGAEKPGNTEQPEDDDELSEPVPDLTEMTEKTEKPSSTSISTTKISRDQIIDLVERNKWIAALIVPVIMALVAPMFSALFSSLAGNSSSIHTIPSPGIVTASSIPTINRPEATAGAASTSTTTVVISVTSTKTIQISQVRPSASTLASALSFAGLLSDKPSDKPSAGSAEPDAQKTLCSVRIHDQHEILVSIPSGNKASWLAKGAIDIVVSRGNEPVRTKLSSVDEGIIVELKQSDAYGVVNVSVVTTRKPKINETFEVDFGKPVVVEVMEASLHMLQGIAKIVSSTADETVHHMVEDAYVPAAAGLAKLRGEAASALKDGVTAAKSHYSETVNRVKHSVGRDDVARLAKNTKERLSRKLQSANNLREVTVLQAQIASKLWWLKFQGKKEEYAEYEQRAARFLKIKHAELHRVPKESAKDAPKEPCGLFGKRQHRCMKDGKLRGGAKGWKKMIKG